MVDWKREAAQDLRDYRARKIAIKSMTAELIQLQADMEHLGGISTDAHVKSSGGTEDDRLINLIVRKSKIESSLRRASDSVGAVEAAMLILDDEERHVLDMFYITPAKGNVFRLCEDLCVEQATVYRRRDTALRKYTIARYGCVED